MSRAARTPPLDLERAHVILYAGGPHPYYWIGTKDGKYIDSIPARDLDAFVRETYK